MFQEEQYAIFIDYSGSVNGRGQYWNIVGNLIKNRNSINRYFFWNERVREVHYDDVIYAQRFLSGRFGTDPTEVAKKIVSLKLTHIIFITDTQINPVDIKRCDKIFEDAKHTFKIQSSICYAISTSSSYLNMSAFCPFTRYGESYVYVKHRQSQIKLFSHCESNDLKMVKDLSFIKLNNFQINLEKLEKVIINQNAGRSGYPEMREQLLILRKRLVHELSTMKTKQDYSKMIRANLEQKDTQAALEYAQMMTYEYMSYEYAQEIERKINYLVSLCGDLSTRFDINEIKSNKIKIAVDVQDAEIEKNIPLEKLTNNVIECPIIMDDDVPQILIDQCEPVLLGFDKKIVDDIAACPLRILNYPEVKAKFKSSISHFIGVKLNGQLDQNPFTRKNILGAIPLGSHPSHVEVGNYTISQFVSGGKLLGNLHMYYAVIWYLINEGEIEFLKPIKENVSEHLVYRFRNSYTTASMCGLGQFVTTQVTSDVALWYIVNSGYFNLPTNRDIFRYHIFNMEPMVKMLRVFKYPLHKGVKEHFFRTRAVLKMLYKLKKYNPNFQKGFHAIFKGLYQKGFFVDITNVSIDFWTREVCAMFIPTDGESDNEQVKRIRQIIPKCCKYLSNEQIYYLSSMLDQSKSASDIYLDYNAVIPPLPKAEINWCYGLKEFDVKVEICPETMRPFTKVGKVSWKQLAKKAFQVEEVSDLFSAHRAFTQYVAKYKRFPISVDQLAIFYYNRYIYSGRASTLPFQTEKWAHKLMELYTEAYTKNNHSQTAQRLYHLSKIQHTPSIQALEEIYFNQNK